MPFITATTDVGLEGLILDGLDLAQGPNGLIQLDAFTPPISKKRPEWIEASDSDGAILARDPLVSNGQAVIKLALVGANRDAAQGLVGQIVDKLEEADRNPQGIPLVWTPSGSTPTLTFYVLTGEVTDFPVDWESGYMVYQPSITITLDCAPYGYGNPITITGAATAGPLVALNLPSVPGDVPATARFIITESSSQSRRTVEWGAEYLHYNPAAPWSLILDSDSLVTTGFAGTQTTTTGAYDPGGAGNNSITTPVTNAAQAICGTGAQPHIGTFRVKARIFSAGDSDESVRLAWRVGDGSYTTNDAAVILTAASAWVEVDLGLITIPETLLGSQSWTGRVDAWSNRAGIVETIIVDYLLLFPVEAGYGKATASYAYSPGVIVARDAFTGTTAGAALNGRTADAGGTWVTSGSTTDLTFADVFSGEMLTRATTSDTGPRIALLGTATPSNVEVSVWPRYGPSFANPAVLGIVARYVDASNYLYAVFVLPGVIAIVQRVAGVETTLGSKFGTSVPGANNSFQLRLVAFSTGRAVLTGPLGTIDVNSAALATGGALATGKSGIYDVNTTASAATRYYDDFSISTPAAEPIALYSTRKLEVRSDDTIRESSAGGTWGQPASYRGSRFKVNPAGTDNRTTRVVAKASRNDLSSAEDANLTDQIALQAIITPRYSVVPRT